MGFLAVLWYLDLFLLALSESGKPLTLLPLLRCSKALLFLTVITDIVSCLVSLLLPLHPKSTLTLPEYPGKM